MADLVVAKVDQVWKDNDPRYPERYLRIVEIEQDGKIAICRSCSSTGEFLPFKRVSRIQVKRLKPTKSGYVL